jgi:pyrroloquinoline quinone biosynthesis protein B
VTAIAVPHRSEFSDTFAFIVSGPSRKLFYCPDIDTWDLWENDLESFLADMDIALLDGTFFSDNELPHNRMADVPHPFVEEACGRLQSIASGITFIHMNHSNPLYREGSERNEISKHGFGIGKHGQRWDLT